jgi:nitrous oxide reductase accessory protein NosL
MKVKSSDPWSAEILYKDGSKLMFESPGDLMTFYSAPDRFDVTDAQKNLSNADKILVKDYHTRSPVDARNARFVHQSKVNGPMGRELVPFADENVAIAFVEANGGTVIKFDQVTPEMVRNLRRN